MKGQVHGLQTTIDLPDNVIFCAATDFAKNLRDEEGFEEIVEFMRG